MANLYVSSASWSAVTAWAASTARSVGQYIRQSATPTVGNERVFRCTTAGTSGATEPTWVLTKNGTTTDGTAVWTECTGQEAYQAPGAWKPYARLTPAVAATAGGDTVMVGSAHAETQATQPNVSSSTTGPTGQISIICVDETASGSVPPTAANVASTASMTTTGSINLLFTGNYNLIQGLNLNIGTGTGSPLLAANATATFRNSIWSIVATGSGNFLTPQNGGAFVCILENISAKFSSVNQRFTPGARFIWRNSVALASGSSVPATMFAPTNGVMDLLCEGVDFSGLSASSTLINASTLAGQAVFKNCKLPAGVTITPALTVNLGAAKIYLINCDSGTGYYRNELYAYGGALTTDPAVTRTGGAADAGVPVSHRIATNAGASWVDNFEGLPLAVYNPSVGATVNVTVYGIANASALPNNDQFWLRVSYLGSATSPLATVVDATKANFLATGAALTADTSAWDANVPARVNSTPYVIGQPIKLASNPGRVFFCTAPGTSAGSEPSSYASATDGISITDGGATFRAGVRFKQSVALSSPTPQAAGYFTATPRIGAQLATYYLDPVPVLS